LRRALEDAGATPVDQETFKILRIEAGIARFGRDMDETNVVPELNLDDAVSYTKGCYVGQEIIVRIKHRGHPAKKLVGLKADQPLEPGAIVTSAAVSPKVGNIGLGYVRYESIEPGTTLLVDNEIKATVTELPFIRGSWYG
jgi:folate-binding protein YgfZ